MANILVKTEQFNDTGEWTQTDLLTVTPNTDAAPAFAGAGAGLADTLVDADGSNTCSLASGFHTITNNGTDWLLSLFVKKDTSTTRFPAMYIDMQNGTRVEAFASLDTKNGLITTVSGLPAFDATGVVDVDAVYWRFWGRKANNSTGNNAIRCAVFVAESATFGGASNPGITGTVIAWGVNLTNTTTVQPYEPDPFYSFVFPAMGGRVHRIITRPAAFRPGIAR
jgi:hypothetical protein